MRKLNILFIALLLLCCVGKAKAEEVTIDGIKYDVITKAKQATVIGNDRANYSGDILIPSEIIHNNVIYSVTSIGEYAFSYCSGLTSIEIPNSVTSIGRGAFSGCSWLTRIEIPNSVTSIGNSVFYGCSGLTSIEIPNSVTSIGSSAFHDCDGLTSITIPNSVTSIGDYAFWNCSGLTRIEIPNSVTSIGDYAFRDCSGLTSIEVPNSVTSIGMSAFHNCSGLTSIEIPNSVTSIGNNVFSGCLGLTSIVIAPGNTKYDSRENCNAIVETESNTLIFGCKNTIIPNSVTNIGNYAFSGCYGLTSIEIPNSVTSIGSGAFYGCETLINVKIPEGIKFIEDETFCHCESLVGIDIPSSVTSIEISAFSNCFRLENIVIPKAVTRISNDGFSGCKALKSIVVESGNPKYDSRENCNAIIETASNTLINGCNSTVIPNSVTSIGRGAFSGCSGLTSIEIPNSVTSIGNSAFYDCSGLTSIEIPNSVTSIGDNAFSYCSGLESITISNSVTNIGYMVFYGTAWYNNQPDGVVYAGNVLYEYKGAMPSNTSVVVKDGTLGIAGEAFSGCSGLTSVTIPNSVTSIGNHAFYDCSGLTGIEIPNSVTSIGDYAFDDCTGLTSVEIPNSVTSIGSYAFSGCSGIESIIVESGNPKYDSRENCNAIIETASNTLINGCINTVIPNSVTSIGEHAFYGCTGLTSIEIPNSVTSIEECAFYDCSKLTNITIPDNLTSVGLDVFSNTPWYNNMPDGVIYIGHVLYDYKGEMPENSSIVVKDGTTMIGGEAFFYCDGLVSIEIPSSVISIKGRAFYGTSWYNNQPDGVVYAGNVLYDYKGEMPENTTIVVRDGTTSITERIFEEEEFLIGVEIPNSVKYIGKCAFCCTAISSIKIPEGVECIEEATFAECYKLTDVVIPKSVKSIGEHAFYDCTSLTNIKSYIAAEDLFVPGSDAFYNVNKSMCTLYVPYGTKDVYALTAGWGDFLNICEFDETDIDTVLIEDATNPNLNVVYDLRGYKIINIENLERGIYIINGKKVLVK